MRAKQTKSVVRDDQWAQDMGVVVYPAPAVDFVGNGLSSSVKGLVLGNEHERFVEDVFAARVDLAVGSAIRIWSRNPVDSCNRYALTIRAFSEVSDACPSPPVR